MIYNSEGTLLSMNLAASKLLNIPLKQTDAGTSYLHVLNRCRWYDERHRPLSLDQLPLSLLLHSQITPGKPVNRFVTASCAECETSLLFCCSPFTDPQQQKLQAVICLLHEMDPSYQQAHNTLRSYQVVATLIEAFLHIPDLLDASAEEPVPSLLLHLQPAGHYLVTAVAQALEVERVLLLAIGPTNTVYYVATYGLSPEQHRHRLEMNGRFSLMDFLDEGMITRLSQHETLMVSLDQIRSPITNLAEFGPRILLIAPIFLQESLTGLLVTHKAGEKRSYSSEEMLLATLTAQLIALVLKYLQICKTADKARIKSLMQQEMNHLVDSLLVSVNHEFRTPLTVVLGNLQLAMRRLQALYEQLAGQTDHFSQPITAVQDPLEQAAQGARTLDRLLTIITHAVQIHLDVFTLRRTHFDVIELITLLVTQQQAYAPGHTLELQIAPGINQVVADRESIQQVIMIYLLNALTRSPLEQPVRIRVEKQEAVVYVAISDRGPAIPPSQQQAIWKRFTRLSSSFLVHELDWSLGLGLYLCREIIRRHRGEVGLQSATGDGTTFWFTLPVHAAGKESDQSTGMNQREEPMQ